jgi:glycosyltransferase involved in cell wall biosynthesis
MCHVLMSCSTVAAGTGMMAAVTPLARALARRGLGVTLAGPITAGEAAVAATDVRPHGPWAHRGRSVPEFRAVLADVKRALLNDPRCSVHVHGVWTAANLAACWACQSSGLSYAVSPHGMLMPEAMRRGGRKKRVALRLAVRRNLERAAAVHVTSEAEAHSVHAVAPRSRVCVVPWGVEVEIAAADKTSVHPTGPREALFLGRLLPLKGVDDLVDAWAIAKPSNWKLRFVGADPEGYSMTLRRRIDAAGLHDVAFVEPPVEGSEVQRLLKTVDLVVLPSHSENFALVVAESLASGVPVITSTATPWHELNARGCGWCVAPAVPVLAEALRDACGRSTQDLAAMGEIGNVWMREAFGWDAIADRFIAEIYGLNL